jgi:hypothetical protein
MLITVQVESAEIWEQDTHLDVWWIIIFTEKYSHLILQEIIPLL